MKVFNDVYNISNRIKDIFKGYYVVYNTSKKKFEIHNKEQIGSSYCLTLPYDQLDERTLKYVRETSSENIDEILNKIENDNNKLESAIKSSAFSNAENIVENLEKDNESY